MKFIEKNPIIMIIIGIIGISVSSIFVKLSHSPGTVTATYRLLWTTLLMSPVVFGKSDIRNELFHSSVKTVCLCTASGFFLAVHFVLWFESLNFTSVASSTTIVCTEVIWVALGFCLFLKGSISKKAVFAIILSLMGSATIAFSSPGDSVHIYG
ncbi:MAG: EamA family transporter, partial [Clostridia bacterium]|nr:EamA family transporter [Clostridia bacterium]